MHENNKRLLEEYFRILTIKYRKPQGHHKYYNYVKDYLQSLGDKNVEEMEVGDVQDYIVSVKKRVDRKRRGPIADGTINYALTAILHFMTHMDVHHDLLPKIKSLKVRKPKPKLEKTPLPVDAVDKLLQQIDRMNYYVYNHKELKLKPLLKQQVKVALQLFYYPGARYMEALQLRWTDIYREDNTIYIQAEKDGLSGRIPVPQTCIDEISKLRDLFRKQGIDSKYLFPMKNPGDYRKDGKIRAILKQAGEAVDINVTPHILRHSIATEMANSGEELLTIQAQLRHKSTTSTLIYIKKADMDRMRKEYAERLKEKMKI